MAADLTPPLWRAPAVGILAAVPIILLQIASKVTPRTVVLPVQSVLTLLTGPILALFLLAILNAGLRRWRPAAAFRPAEFALIYAITTVAASIGSADEGMQLWPMFVFPFRETQAKIAGPFRQYIAHWLVPQSPAVVEPYYLGGGTFWKPELIAAWAVPFCCWMLWLAALGATMWAWNVILRRRWIDHDRLSFPCAQLPLEICRAGGFGGRVAGRFFWIGFAVTAGIESLNRISELVPSVPSLPFDFAASQVLNAAPTPWNALSPMSLTWSPIHLGVCYFVPLDILFSGWFFYLLRKVAEVFGYAMGWRDLGWDAAGFPFTRSQAAGAWCALFFILVWAERRHLARVLAAGFSRRVAVDDAEEPGSYRWAARLLVGGTLFLFAWSVFSGMSPGLALVFYAFFWMLNVTMTRIYAQVGPPVLELYFLDPQTTLTRMIGTVGQSPRSLTMFSLMYWINRTDRGHPMAHQLASFYVGRGAGTPPRRLGRWVFFAFLLGITTCLIAYLHWAYRAGEDQFVEGAWRETFSPLALERLNQWVNAPAGPAWKQIGFMVIGAIVTLALAKANFTFIGFPFHPIGFALAMCYGVEYNWPAFLGIWLFKGLLLRYSGRTAYLRFAPFFLGLILADLVTPVGWGFAGWLFEWYR